MENQVTISKQCMNCGSLKPWEELAKFIAIGEREFFLCKTCDADGRVCFSCGIWKPLAEFKIHFADDKPYFSAICEGCDPTGIDDYHFISKHAYINVLNLTNVKLDELPLLIQQMLDNPNPEARQEFDKDSDLFTHTADKMTADNAPDADDTKTQELKRKLLERQKSLGLFSAVDKVLSDASIHTAKTAPKGAFSHAGKTSSGSSKMSAGKRITQGLKRAIQVGIGGGLIGGSKVSRTASASSTPASKQTASKTAQTSTIRTSVRGNQMRDMSSHINKSTQSKQTQTTNKTTTQKQSQSSQTKTFIGKATTQKNISGSAAHTAKTNVNFAKVQYVVPSTAQSTGAAAQAARASSSSSSNSQTSSNTSDQTNTQQQQPTQRAKDTSSLRFSSSFSKKA